MIENCLKQWNREWELDFHSHFWMIIMCRTLNPKPVHGEHKGSWWTQSTLRSANNLLPGTPLGFELTTSALIPLVGPQTLPTLLKAIACKKDAYPNLIVHSPKCPRANTRGVDGRGQPSDLPTWAFDRVLTYEFLLIYCCL